jgi:hypothetical protein
LGCHASRIISFTLPNVTVALARVLRRGKLDSSGPWHPAGRPLDILRARSSHHVKPTSAHINQAYFSPYYLLWASTDADRIVLFLSDHVCTSRSIRFIAGAKMTPSRHFWCPVCVDLCFLNTARTQFAFDVNDNIDRLWKLKRCLSK